MQAERSRSRFITISATLDRTAKLSPVRASASLCVKGGVEFYSATFPPTVCDSTVLSLRVWFLPVLLQAQPEHAGQASPIQIWVTVPAEEHLLEAAGTHWCARLALFSATLSFNPFPLRLFPELSLVHHLYVPVASSPTGPSPLHLTWL